MDDRTHFIYGLREPNKPIRYVGVSVNPADRLQSHIRTRHVKSTLYEWLEDLRTWQIFPELVILDQCSHKDRYAAETGWMLKAEADLNMVPSASIMQGREYLAKRFSSQSEHTESSNNANGRE